MIGSTSAGTPAHTFPWLQVLAAPLFGLAAAVTAHPTSPPFIAGVSWPARPEALSEKNYPDCVNQYRRGTSDEDIRTLAESCAQKLEWYNAHTLNRFGRTTQDYLNRLLTLDGQFRHHLQSTQAISFRSYIQQEQEFYQRVDSHGDNGPGMDTYYQSFDQYKHDSALLCKVKNDHAWQRQYC